MPLRLGVDPRFRNRERQPGLDLLRALATIVVIVYHAALFGFKLPGRVDRFGWIGVDFTLLLISSRLFSGCAVAFEILRSVYEGRGRTWLFRSLAAVAIFRVPYGASSRSNKS